MVSVLLMPQTYVRHAVTHDVYDLYELHQKKGSLIRYGPNRISVSSLEGFEAIYGTHNSPFLKDRSYYLAFVVSTNFENSDSDARIGLSNLTSYGCT